MKVLNSGGDGDGDGISIGIDAEGNISPKYEDIHEESVLAQLTDEGRLRCLDSF